MDIDNNTIRQFQFECKQHARRRRYPQEADDFAQEAAIAFVRGRKATIEQLFIDYLRARHGDARARGYCPGPGAKNREISLDERKADTDGLSLLDTIAASGHDPRPEPYDWRSRANLSLRDEVICQLYFDDEIVLAEIGEMLGITESMVSQRLKRVKKEIESVVLLSEKMAEYKDDSQVSKLEVNWITL